MPIATERSHSPILHVTNTGLLHALLGLDTAEHLFGHPKVGASWEGFAMTEVVRLLEVPWDRCYHWATHQGAELDLLVLSGGKRLGFEFKRTSAPRATRSMHSALEDLKLDRLSVIYPGDRRFPLHERVEAVGFRLAMESGLS